MKDRAPSVSVIIPCYNQACYLHDAVRSVLEQTFDDWEILIVNDGSPDNTGDTAREIIRTYEGRRIRLIEKENGGLSSARNEGIAAAEGKYILPLDADDMLHPDYLLKTATVLERKPEYAIVYVDEHNFGDSHHIHQKGTVSLERLLSSNIHDYCSIYRKEVWYTVGGYSPAMYLGGEDWNFWCGAAKLGFKSYHVNRPLFLYRNRKNTMVAGTNANLREVKAHIVLHHPELFSRVVTTEAENILRTSPEENKRILESVLKKNPDNSMLRRMSFIVNEAGEIINKPPRGKGPLVSVIIPTYNRPEMLADAINSVLDQTYRNYEIIVVNDAGDDISGLIGSLNAGNNITYLCHKENRGLAASRNTGLKEAKGKYIAYLDDDDIYYPAHLEVLTGCLEGNGARVAYSDSYQVVQHMVADRYITTEKRITYSEEFDRDRLLVMNYIPVINVMHHRDCVEESGLFDEGLTSHEDWDLLIRLSRKYDFHHAGQVTAEFRTRCASADSLSSDRKKILETMKLVHSRYASLAADHDVVERQKEAERDIEKEIEQKERVGAISSGELFVPIVNANIIPSITAMVSVIIPVLNGGRQLGQLLGKIRSQRKVENVDIVIVDSESDDDSVRTAGEFGAKVTSVPRKDFNHGTTRNLGASCAAGEYLVFTVQDALPASDYWLYKMVSPFMAYPELAALSAKQYVRPEADLFSQWENRKMTPHDNDCMWSLGGRLCDEDWRLLEPRIKDVLLHLDDVSSCFRRDVFNAVRFQPLMFGEDMDIGRRLIQQGKCLGYLTSTGVYHWHERGAAYLLQRFYIGARSDYYIKENRLPYFFNNNNMDFVSLVAQIQGTYDLIRVSMHGLCDSSAETVTAVKTLLGRLEKNIQSVPSAMEHLLRNNNLYSDKGLELLLRQISGDRQFGPIEKYGFRKNVIIPNFMDYFSQFSEYICGTFSSLSGREDEFTACVFKIFSMAAGVALGAFYLEAESLGRLSGELEGIDRLLGQGVSLSRDMSEQK